MSAAQPLPGTDPSHGLDGEELIDLALIRAWIGFGLGSLRRHRWLALSVFLAGILMSAGALWALPKTYHVDARIVSQSVSPLSTSHNPGEGDAPTRAASDLVLRRDNLIALVKQTNLVEQFEKGRSPAQQVMAFIRRVLNGPPTEDDKVDALVGMLEKRLTVYTGDGAVTLNLYWPDPHMAYRLVDAAQQNFIEARHALEVSTIAESISILEWHATGVRDNITSALEELRRARESAAKPEAATAAPRPAAAPVRTPADQEIAQLESMVTARKKAIADLEEYRSRRLTELQGQLAEQKAVYGPSHPAIANAELSIAELQKDSPQLSELRREEKAMREDLAARVASRAAAPPDRTAAPPPVQINPREGRRESPLRDDDQSLEYLRNQLRVAREKYEELTGRIDAARIDLDKARAAFKYRYSIVQPPLVPKKPESPKPPLVVGAGMAMGALLALVVSLAADLRRARIVESWQIEQLLKVPVLGEVRLP